MKLYIALSLLFIISSCNYTKVYEVQSSYNCKSGKNQNFKKQIKAANDRRATILMFDSYIKSYGKDELSGCEVSCKLFINNKEINYTLSRHTMDSLMLNAESNFKKLPTDIKNNLLNRTYED